MGRYTENRKTGLVIVFVFAAIVRAVYIYSQSYNPLSTFAISDSYVYLSRALEILDGEWLSTGIPAFSGEVLYVYILAAILAVFGKDNFLAVQIIQHLMGAASCALIYLTALRLYSRGAALIVGLWGGALSPLLFHEGLTLSTAPTVFFLTLSLYLIVITVSRSDVQETGAATTASAALSAGFFLGVSALLRPNMLLLAPVYLLWVVIKDPGRMLRTLTPYAVILGLMLAVGPVTLKNRITGGDWVLMSSNGGWVFFIGNNPEANGIFHIPERLGVSRTDDTHITMHRVAEAASGRALSTSEASSYWKHRALGFLKAEPARAAALYMKKFALFWNARELTHIYEYEFFGQFSRLLRNPFTGFGPLAVMGLLGAFWMLGAPRREVRLVPLLAGAYMSSLVIFYISSRMRVPVAVFLLLSSGYGLSRLTEAATPVKRALIALSAVVIFLFVYMDVSETRAKAKYAGIYTKLAGDFADQGDLDSATLFLDAAVSENPGNLPALANAGLTAESMGNTGLAKDYYGRIISNEAKLKDKAAPDTDDDTGKVDNARSVLTDTDMLSSFTARKQLGVIYLREKNPEEAESHLEAALELYPESTEAMILLGIAYENQRKDKEALMVYERYLTLNPGDKKVLGWAEKLRAEER